MRSVAARIRTSGSLSRRNLEQMQLGITRCGARGSFGAAGERPARPSSFSVPRHRRDHNAHPAPRRLRSAAGLGTGSLRPGPYVATGVVSPPGTYALRNRASRASPPFRTACSFAGVDRQARRTYDLGTPWGQARLRSGALWRRDPRRPLASGVRRCGCPRSAGSLPERERGRPPFRTRLDSRELRRRRFSTDGTALARRAGPRPRRTTWRSS